jgi:osmotically-inducible protein OsmY
MRVFLALVVGVALGAAGFWLLNTRQGNSTVRYARDSVQEKLRALDLRTNDFKEELARNGQIIRRKAGQAGQAIADATADARITAAIKAKLLGSRDLSALSVSVNTTGGIVTLSGRVASAADISKAMLLAMETDGVREVISTLQLK